MITGELKSQVDAIWNSFWTGGISNPLKVIEQFTYLLFIKRLDDLQNLKEVKANRFRKPIEAPIFSEEQSSLRWSKFRNYEAEKMLETVRDEVFPFIKSIHEGEDTSYSKQMKDAIFEITKPSLLVDAVESISNLPMDDRDTKGDLYEYLLSKLTTAGVNGQFRTPRHIIKMMTEMLEPNPNDSICDPACGTGGFLMASEHYLRENHPDLFRDAEKTKHYHNTAFNGFDFDATMLRIGVMNLMLHGVENPNIQYRDSLSSKSEEVAEEYTVVLANPPFKGSLDYGDVADNLLRVVKTKKTEILFLALLLRLLKVGGRGAVIIPDGVLFGSSKAHVEIRKNLLEEQQLQAVISMPSGVFKPYAGVSTGILIFTKTNSGGTENVWFYDMQADGYSLDDKRNELDQEQHETNNLPDILTRWKNLDGEVDRKRTEQSFFVPKSEIIENKYDLSINRYKEIVYEEVHNDPPKQIIAEIEELQTSINSGLEELKGMLG